METNAHPSVSRYFFFVTITFLSNLLSSLLSDTSSVSLVMPLSLHVGASYPGGNSRITAKISVVTEFILSFAPEILPQFLENGYLDDFLRGLNFMTTVPRNPKDILYISFFIF